MNSFISKGSGNKIARMHLTKFKNFLSKPTGTISTKLCKETLSDRDSHEGLHTFTRGDNYEIAKIH